MLPTELDILAINLRDDLDVYVARLLQDLRIPSTLSISREQIVTDALARTKEVFGKHQKPITKDRFRDYAQVVIERIVDELELEKKGPLEKLISEKGFGFVEGAAKNATAVASSSAQSVHSPVLSIIVDAVVDTDPLVRFLAELSAVYSELSEGDELVIREGKIPVLQSAPV